MAHLCKLSLPESGCTRVSPAPDFAKGVDEQAQQFHVDNTRHCTCVSAVNKRMFFGAKSLGKSRALCAEVDGSVATWKSVKPGNMEMKLKQEVGTWNKKRARRVHCDLFDSSSGWGSENP